MFKKTVVGSLMVLLGACSMCKSYPAATVGVETHTLVASVAAPTPPVEEKKEIAILPATPSYCPDGMVEVNGDYYPTVKQTCLGWRDGVEGQRCLQWVHSVTTEGKPVHKHYCIDRYEYPNRKGEIPQDWMSWHDIKHACEGEGKRLCTRSEWTFAAEGPDRHPYPYGDGYKRDASICNFDNHLADQPATIKRADGRMTPPTGDDVMNVTSVNSDVGQALHNMLVPSGSKEDCVSGWGVHDMSGNIDEWVVNETGKPFVSGLMGGHVFGVRNASRPMTDAHNPEFKWYESGGRCCLTP